MQHTAQTGRETAADLAEEDGLGRVCGVHRVLIHPAGSDKASLRETATCVGACQPTTSLCRQHTLYQLLYTFLKIVMRILLHSSMKQQQKCM